jgi:hypothetical protein
LDSSLSGANGQPSPKPWLMCDFHSFCAAFYQPNEAFEGWL